MPCLEELIFSRLTGDTTLAGMLAKYGTQAAVFELQAPADNDKGWGAVKQLPRVVYSIDKQENPERKVSGRVVIDAVCGVDSENGPEDIEARIRTLLSGVFFEPSNEPTMALVWNATNAFDEDEAVIGCTVTFDMLAFPRQTTTAPDPISGMIAATKTLYPNAHLFDTDPAAPYMWTPTAENPAIYWRIAGFTTEMVTNSVIWMTGNIVGHVFAPTPSDRLPIMRALVEKFAIMGRVALSDDSPLIIQRMAADSNRDALRDGQITVTAKYGILYPEPETPQTPLNHAYLNGKEV